MALYLRTLFRSARGFLSLASPALRRTRPTYAATALRRLHVRTPRLEQLEERTLLSVTYFIDDSATGLNTGADWANAFVSLQSALTKAVAGDQIHLAQGTYKPTTGTDRSISFSLKTGVAIYGGYAGVGAPDPDARNVAFYPSIFSGDIGTAGDIADNSYHVVVADSVNTAVLDGFTVTAGNANGSSSPTAYGGGMYISLSSATITNCIFTTNSAKYGGGTYSEASLLTITSCTFTANRASLDGGGMFNYASPCPSLANCTFEANSGCGMCNATSSPTLTSCTFRANSGIGMRNEALSSAKLTNCTFEANSGPGMYNSSSSPTLVSCTFRGNFGGGMYNSSSSPKLTNCTFTLNSATSSFGGGMYNLSSSSPTLVNCTFTANSTSFGGGGMYNSSSSPTLTNCAFIANVATGSFGGGGMYNSSSSSPTLTNCTLMANSANRGSAMYNDSASPMLINCILWAKTTANDNQIDGDSSSRATVTYCDVQGGYSGTGNINVPPEFARNPNPGPDGKWCTADDDYGDLRLRLASPCIDAGNNAALSAVTDLAGTPRFVDIPAKADTGSGTAPLVDLGAYEVPVAVQALAGGPYRVPEGKDVVLMAQGYTFSSDRLPLSYAWDFDGDGIFDDSTGQAATFSAQGIQAPGALRVSVRVTDALGASAIDSAIVTVFHAVYVDDNAAGLNDGTSWENAFTSLQSALALAVVDDEIHVAQGTYKPTTSTDRTISFALKSGVAIHGGYAGVGASNPDARNVLRYPSILSGDIGIAGGDADNSYHVVVASSVDATATLDGFTITAGNANGAASSDYGGGMYNSASSPTLTNCTFIANAASFADGIGGGMYNSSSSPTLTNCAFNANMASGGGGMYNDFSSPTVTNCTFTANSAIIDRGGGMYNSSSSPILTNCTFTANSADWWGGGVYNRMSSRPSLTNCIVWANTSRMFGPIYNSSTYPASTPVVNYCDVQGGYSGTRNIDVDPQFVRKPDSGPDGIWGTADDVYGDLRLLLTSPCIDAGNNNTPIFVATNLATTDLAGNPRFVDIPTVADTGSGAVPIIDLGAYEASLAVEARAGGPYVVLEGDSIVLSGDGYSPSGLSLSYAWDLDGDGQYDDATGPSPVFSAAGLRPQTLTIALRVTDTSGGSAIDYTAARVRRLSSLMYVDDTATGMNTGMSWADAFTSLQSALTAAIAGDEIHVAQGIYKPTADMDRTMSFALKQGIAVYGGYAGVGAPDPSARDVTLYPSILSGDIGTLGDMADNSYHVVTVYSVDVATILDGFTITAGNANGTSSWSYGGGMYNFGSSLTLANCLFAANAATSGGGMFIQCSSFPAITSPTMTNCVFTANSAVSGGGMYNYVSTPTLTNCTVTANTASSGGGLYNHSSTFPRLTNCILWANTATSGSQIYNDDVGFVVTYCDVQEGYSGTSNINVDPQFIRAPSPGADGTWGSADDDFGDLRLQLTSRCIDAGNNAAVPAGVTTDMAGKPRFVDVATVTDIGNGTPPVVDMGAYEAWESVHVGDLLYVDDTAAGSNDGTSWADAFTSLQSALAVAVRNDEIRVAQGTYKPTTDTDRTISFALKQGIAIYGGYAGVGAPDSDSRNVALYPSILSGDIGTVGDTADNSYHVVTGGSLDVTAILDGFTITAGNANGTSSAGYGGGLYNSASSPTIASCIFTANTATNGGGVYNSAASAPTLTNCTFITNSATSGYGGGLYNDGSSPTLNVCTFTANAAASGGGGLVNFASSSPLLTNCQFTANLVTSGTGGGMYNDGSSPTLKYCTFTANTSTSGGGGLANFASSSPLLTNCRFTANLVTSGTGGGIYNTAVSSPTLTMCEFTANSATSGGGVYNVSSSPALTNCTFTANSAISGTGGGIYNGTTSSPTLINCIFWANTATDGSQITKSVKGSTKATYCDVQGGYGGTGNINADPQFIHAPSPGPDSIWGTVDDDFGDLRLMPASPCIDAGNNAAVPPGATTDLADNPRFVDVPGIPDTGSGTAPIVDLGAHESPNPALALGGSGGFTLGLMADHASIQIVAPNGSYTYAAAAISSLAFTGGTGDDRLTIDFTNGNPLSSGGLVFDAGMQSTGDCLVVQGTTNGQQVTLEGNKVKLDGQEILTLTGVEAFAFDLGGAGGTLPGDSGLVKTGPGTLVLAGTNTYPGDTTVLGGKLIVAEAGALPSGTSLVVNGGSVMLDSGSTTAIKVSGLRFPSLHRPAAAAQVAPNVLLSLRERPNQESDISRSVMSTEAGDITRSVMSTTDVDASILLTAAQTESAFVGYAEVAAFAERMATLTADRSVSPVAIPTAPAAESPTAMPIVMPSSASLTQNGFAADTVIAARAAAGQALLVDRCCENCLVMAKPAAQQSLLLASPIARAKTPPAVKQQILHLASLPTKSAAPVKKAISSRATSVTGGTKAKDAVLPARAVNRVSDRITWLVNIWQRTAKRRP